MDYTCSLASLWHFLIPAENGIWWLLLIDVLCLPHLHLHCTCWAVVLSSHIGADEVIIFRLIDYTSRSSTLRFSALELIKCFRGATASPINILSA
jgi:hypothetical protein